MTNINATEVYTRYWGASIANNPVFEDIISGLIDAGLYTSALYDSSSDAFKSIGIYANGLGASNKAVPLDVIVDVISRSILKNLQTGFNSGLKNAGSNISFTGLQNISVDLASCTNVSQAINLLGQELMAIKIQLAALTGGAYQTTPVAPAIASDNLLAKINIK